MRISRGKRYAKLTEDDPNQQITRTGKTYAPVTDGSKTLTPTQIKMSIYAKEFLITSSGLKNSDICFGVHQNHSST